MEIANIMLGIDGRDTTVPKTGVTAAEIAVLRSIHGETSVFDIEPAGAIGRANRQELVRLRQIYGGAKDGNGVAIVDGLFPGAAARVFETLAELELPEEFFRPITRAVAPTAAEPAAAPAAEEDLDDMTKAELLAYAKSHGIEVDAGDKKAEILAAIANAEAPAGNDADEIGAMPDQNLFK